MKPNSIPQVKKVDLPSTKVSPPKENPHLMTHDYFVKSMDNGKMLWTKTDHWANAESQNEIQKDQLQTPKPSTNQWCWKEKTN